jgi:SnoaL-like domain
MVTIEELQVRLTRLADIKEIQNLQKIYGYYQDYCEWEKVVDLFTDNTPSVEEADRGVYKGKKGVRRYFIELLGGGGNKPVRAGYLGIMFQFQGVVTVSPDGKTATGRWYGMGMEAKPIASLHEGELRQTWVHGIYENEYVKENGVWKFKKLYFNLVFRTPFEDGWLKVPVVGQNGPDRIVKPDAPPTAYFPYPSGYQVPISFPHPTANEKKSRRSK